MESRKINNDNKNLKNKQVLRVKTTTLINIKKKKEKKKLLVFSL